MHRSTIVALLLITWFAAAAPAQEEKTVAAGKATEFEKLFNRFEAGEDVSEELDDLVLANTKARVEDRFNAAYVISVIKISMRSWDEAIGFLEKAESLKQGTAQVDIRRAEALLGKGDKKEAKKSIEEAGKSLDGKKKGALWTLQQIVQARVEAANDDAKKALQRLETLANTAKDQWEVHFRIGQVNEQLDKPKDALAAYERVIALDNGKDPFGGIYAYQRWAALTMSSDPGSYGKKDVAKRATERYDAFLARAEANRVPRDLVQTTEQANGALKIYVLGQK